MKYKYSKEKAKKILQKYNKGGGVDYVPVSEKISKQEKESFLEYVNEYYGKKGIYADQLKGGFTKSELKKAVDKYLKELGNSKTWGGGDSLDRERVRQILEPSYKMFMNGGSIGLPAGAEQSYVNYYLNEGASVGIFAEGGSIENQYEGKTAKEVWNMWNLDQREHFLADHYDVLMGKDLGSKNKKFEDLADITQIQLELHISQGQYAMGGSLGNHGLKQGDKIIKTMSGGIQKIKTKDGQTMYVDLASGYRGAEPPLPFANGGALTNERRHVNKSEDYEVRYAKNKPNRTGYKGKRSFDDGGFMTDPSFGDFQNQVYDKGGSFEKLKWQDVEVGDSARVKEINRMGLVVKTYGRKFHLKFPNGTEKTFDASELEFFKLENDDYANGGRVENYTTLSFKNKSTAERNQKDIINYFGNRVLSSTIKRGIDERGNNGYYVEYNLKKESFATGGVTKNYINRNQLNTITIKKGNQKLTYKVSDVYNGAYKLEEGGKLEKTAFYVSKRNVVKVQLKDGRDVKVANGYWIKKGAKPIHTSKYDDGGMTEKEFMQNEINSQKEKEKGMVFKKYRVNVYENGFPFVEPLMTDNLVEAVNFAKKTIEEQRKYRTSSKDLFAEISEFTPIEKRDNVRYAYNRIGSLSEEDLKSSKFEDGGQLEMKFLKGGKLESKIQKKVDEVNSLIEKAIDKDGDPIMVVDKSGTWEEPMQYKPIVYKNGRLYFEYYEPYSGKTKKEVVNKSNIEFDGYPMLLDIAKMYRRALKEKGVSFGGGGSINKQIEINSEIEKIIKEIKSKGKYEKGKESVNVKGQKYRWDLYKLENPSYLLIKKIDSIQFKNYGQRTLSNSFDYRKLQLPNNKDITIDRPIYKGQSSKFVTYRELVLLNEGGGKTTFKEKATAIAKKFEGKKVEPKYQKEYGKTYDKAEAKEVGNKIAGSQKAKYDAKMSNGGKTTKRGGAMVLAKQIRKEGESWASALKRANEQMRNK